MKAFCSAGFSSCPSILLALALSACSTAHQKASPYPSRHPSSPQAHCPAEFTYHYSDIHHHFSICLPVGATSGDTNGYGFPPGSRMFRGFALPSGTDLLEKRLLIVPGANPDMQDVTPDGQFTADGVTFSRSKASEGAAGHYIYYIFYTWSHNGQTLGFEFFLDSGDVGAYPPESRPAHFDYDAQVKFSERVMETFRRLQ